MNNPEPLTYEQREQRAKEALKRSVESLDHYFTHSRAVEPGPGEVATVNGWATHRQTLAGARDVITPFNELQWVDNQDDGALDIVSYTGTVPSQVHFNVLPGDALTVSASLAFTFGLGWETYNDAMERDDDDNIKLVPHSGGRTTQPLVSLELFDPAFNGTPSEETFTPTAPADLDTWAAHILRAYGLEALPSGPPDEWTGDRYTRAYGLSSWVDRSC